MGLADTASLIAKLSLKGNFTSGIKTASRELGKFDSKLDRSQSRAHLAGQQIGTGVKNVGKLAVAGGAALVGLGVASLNAAGDFEASLNTINTIARKTPPELEKIGDAIRATARESGAPLEDLTQGYYDLLSAGIQTADAQGVLAASTKLAVGGLATTAETVDLLTTAINTYGGDATKAAGYADVFAKSVERGKVTAAEIANSFATVGSIAASSGIEIEELAAGYARLTSAGVPAAEAATQMRSAIVSLTRTTAPLEKLQKQTGKNYLSIAGKDGLAVAFEQLRVDAKKAGVPLIELVGRVEALNFANLTTGENADKYAADLLAMGDAAGTAAEQMSERQKGLNYQLDILRANAKDAGITIGSALLPKITPLFQRFNKFLNDPATRTAIADFADDFANLFSESNVSSAAETLGTLFGIVKDAAPAIAASAKITGQVLGTAVKLFTSLPKEIQSLAIGALAINKLTGGLVTNIAGGIFGALKAMTVQAAVVNVTGGVVNGGGIPGKGGLPGAAAAAAGIGTGAAVAAIAAAVATTVISSIPFIERNNALEDRGLNSAEIAAVKYYSADKAAQQTIAKRLGYVPDKKDADTGNAKLSATVKREIAHQRTATDRVRTAQQETKRETTRGSAIVASAERQGSAAIVGAIQRIPPPVVNVRVSPTTITNVRNVTNRYGTTGGSRNRNSTGSGTLGNGGR